MAGACALQRAHCKHGRAVYRVYGYAFAAIRQRLAGLLPCLVVYLVVHGREFGEQGKYAAYGAQLAAPCAFAACVEKAYAHCRNGRAA